MNVMNRIVGITPWARWAAVWLCAMSTGCASLSNPVANGIPVQRVPPELLAESKTNYESLPLTSLRQPPPEAYILAPDDILGVWIDGVLGEKGQLPPVRYSEKSKLPPAIGIPVPVRPDGKIHLPFVDPIKVSGMTVEEAEQAVRKAYTVTKQILQPGRDRIYVTLQQPRHYHILVIRQDSGTNTSGQPASGPTGTGFVIAPGATSQQVTSGRGFSIDLPAYENDVLNALANTGGFPGSDAVNEIIIERSVFKGGADRAEVMKKLPAMPDSAAAQGENQVVRIPLRYRKGQKPELTPEKITLHTGDVVYIPGRQGDFYYTSGILPSRTFLLPRDTDLDVVEAIIRAGGVLNSGGLSSLNVSGTTGSSGGGLGNPSPRLLSVLRQMPNGKQAVITVDLARAQRDPRERILVQAKDILIMQSAPQDAMLQYLRGVVQFTTFYNFLNSSRATGTGNATYP